MGRRDKKIKEMRIQSEKEDGREDSAQRKGDKRKNQSSSYLLSLHILPARMVSTPIPLRHSQVEGRTRDEEEEDVSQIMKPKISHYRPGTQPHWSEGLITFQIPSSLPDTSSVGIIRS